MWDRGKWGLAVRDGIIELAIGPPSQEIATVGLLWTNYCNSGIQLIP